MIDYLRSRRIAHNAPLHAEIDGRSTYSKGPRAHSGAPSFVA